MESLEWAAEEFGRADLGDLRRVRRLTLLAAAAVERPCGYVSEVARNNAERTGAYRLLHNTEIDVEEVSAAARGACLARSRGYPFVYVAEDGSSLAFSDVEGTKGFGIVGTHTAGARGFLVMNAVVMAPDGTPLGIGAQKWWNRGETPVAVDHHQRAPEEKETRYWVEVAHSVATDFSKADAPRPWFQFDRGADAWYVLDEAIKRDWWVTVRSAKNRRLETPRGAPKKYLQQAVREAAVMTRFAVEISPGHGRAARTAVVEVRVAEVTLRLQDDRTSRSWPVRLWAVWAHESSPPPGTEPLDWLLLTTRPVRDETDALDTVIGYRLRWRVEEFHRSWKSAGCNVEITHLEGAHAVQMWAVVLASVAVRMLRMTYLSRNSPDLPAKVELTEIEIEAAFLLVGRAWDRSIMPTIAEVTHMIARAGGHAPSRRGPPPGAEVLARGLARHSSVVSTMRALMARGVKGL